MNTSADKMKLIPLNGERKREERKRKEGQRGEAKKRREIKGREKEREERQKERGTEKKEREKTTLMQSNQSGLPGCNMHIYIHMYM